MPAAQPSQLKTTVFFLVHPGSLCGSATFFYGRKTAGAMREKIIRRLNDLEATEGFVVVTSVLSDEIPGHQSYALAIANALRRCQKSISGKFEGCEDIGRGPAKGASAAAKKLRLDPKRHSIVLSGAWYEPADKSLKIPVGGCVEAAREALAALGFTCVIDASVGTWVERNVGSHIKPKSEPSSSPAL